MMIRLDLTENFGRKITYK